MGLFCIAVITCVLSMNIGALSQSDIGLCSQVYLMQQYCTMGERGGVSPAPNQGSPRIGKAGPRGPTGSPGRPAQVDYSAINATIHQMLAPLLRKVEQLEGVLSWYKATNGYFYKVFLTKVDYATAKAKCIEHGAILASVGIRDTDVRGELVHLMKTVGDHTWIGVNDIEIEGTWVWEDGVVSNGRDIDWYRRQPDNGSGNENCAHYHPSYGWKVNDDQCYNSKMFLCEKQL